MERPDALLDLVFRRLLTRDPVLLVDLLEGVLERPIASATVLESRDVESADFLGEHGLAIDVTLADGSHMDVRMAIPNTRVEAEGLVFGSYPPTPVPTAVVLWLRQPLIPSSGRLHSIFEFSERTTARALGDGFEVHAIQLLALGKEEELTNDYERKLERWARFLIARNQGLLDELAAEDPVMATALQRYDELSADPEVCRLAEERRVALAAAR